ncbi:hypothetical protein [Phenylobacterium sp.]|jgi:Flp pilus assembly protein TadD|uniref:hypothetical protein n=1 Tax=Phenylobacterium sp. TaxID=1871053 RepID=UPI002F942DDB
MGALKPFILGVVGGLLLLVSPAQAAWTRAETERFVVYGDVADFIVQDYAARLTAFDAVLRFFHPPPARARPQKLSVYIVRNRGELQNIRPGLSPLVAGFYTASRRGVFAVTAIDREINEDDTLFHEYAHHFMLENFPGAYPAWYIEGWAEYFMTAELTPNGMKVGDYNPGRIAFLGGSGWLPMDQVIGKRQAERDPEKTLRFYSQAWLLTHYMRSDPQRAAQLDKAIVAIANGAEPVKAFQDATGMSMNELQQALRRYTTLRMIEVKDIGKVKPPMTVTRMPASAEDLLLDRLRITASGGNKPDPEFVTQVRRAAAKHPGDKFAELTLAEAEFRFGDVAAGEAIVNRRLAAEPDDVETLTVAGWGQIEAGEREPGKRAERFRAGRPHLVKAYQLSQADFRPLYGYVYSRTVEGFFPTENDMLALLEARKLAPSVDEVSILAGITLLAQNHPEDARRVLEPVANNPHGGGAAAQARALLQAKSQADINAAAAAGEAEDQREGGGRP